MAGLVIGTTDVPVGRLASRLDCNPQKEERSLSAPTYTGERSMTTMNNEDPADPNVHEPRELPEPVAYLHDVVAADGEPDQALSFAPDNFPLMGVGGFRSVAYRPLYTADQMREAIAAEREQQTKPPKWWTCQTHGDAQPNAWGCPECVREMRSELDALREAIEEAAADCELHPLYMGDAATLDDIIRMGGDAAFVTGLARGLRETLAREQPK